MVAKGADLGESIIKQYKLSDGSEIICEVLKQKIGETGAMQVRNCLQIQKMISPVDVNTVVYKFTPWFTNVGKDEPVNLRISSIIANVQNSPSEQVITNYHEIVDNYFVPTRPAPRTRADDMSDSDKAIRQAMFEKMSGEFTEQ